MIAKFFRLSDRLEPSESLEAKRFEPCVDRKATLGEPFVTKASVDAAANNRAILTRSFMILDYCVQSGIMILYAMASGPCPTKGITCVINH
jgi:hypothetical protein